MSVSLGSQCPSCQKEFLDDSRVLRHMNNPHTSCQSWLQFLESTLQGVSGPSTTAHPSPSSQANDTTNNNESASNNDTTHDNESTSDNDMSATMHYEDVHPNAPSFFGSGPTFMDKFSTDSHADKREENLYYPFRSREEWSLSSWLLCSGLSMRAIDDFLALPIVNFHTLHHHLRC